MSDPRWTGVLDSSPTQRYTHSMKSSKRRYSIILLSILLLSILASCSSGHLGGNEMAFIRDGHLWTIDPGGANAFEVVSDGPPVVGYAWSPNHQILVFRTLDSSFASTAAGRHITSNPLTGLTADIPSVLNTVGLDGGSPIPIIFSSPDQQYSNAWWNPTGNRLLYREETTSTNQNPGAVTWWVSQNDQPEGIARKLLPYTFSIPSLSVANSLAIGNSEQGIFTTTLAGTNFKYVVQGALPGHPLPAALERVLWQPSHQNPAILYAIVTATASIQLVLRDPRDRTTAIATCRCTQFAWSPDGNSVLYTTGTTYIIFNIKDNSTFSISGEEGSVPYWSPNSQFLVLDGPHTLQLVHIANQQHQLLLHDMTPVTEPGAASSRVPDAHALLQPVSNSIWSSDSHHFLFLTRGRLLWQSKNFSSGNGLYNVTIDTHGRLQGIPAIVDTGNDSQAGWTYEDPNTSFLF
jgi:hypothetical protein